MSLIYPNTSAVKAALTELDSLSLVPEITGLLAGWDNRTPHVSRGDGTDIDILLANSDIFSDLFDWFTSETEQLGLRGDLKVLLGKVGISGQTNNDWHNDRKDRATVTFADEECPVNPSTSTILRLTSPTDEQTRNYEAEIAPLLRGSPTSFGLYTGKYIAERADEGSVVTLFDSTIHSETNIPTGSVKLSLARFK